MGCHCLLLDLDIKIEKTSQNTVFQERCLMTVIFTFSFHPDFLGFRNTSLCPSEYGKVENACVVNLVAQSCQTLCDPMDCSPPGSSVLGILQARTLERVAMPSSRGSSQPRSPTLQADSLPSEPPGKPPK